VIADYSTPDGHLKTIPSQRKKLDVILRYVSRAFKPDIKYSENEVNQILKDYHADTSSLRRELISMGILKRSAGGREYWLAEE
jgi:hypothetical protein